MGRINCADEKKGFTDEENVQILSIIAEAKDDLYVTEYQAYFDLDDNQKTTKDGVEIGASVEVDGQYLTISITFYPKAVKVFRDNFETFRHLIYHEVAHIIVDPLHNLLGKMLEGLEVTTAEDYLIDERWESAVERISRIALILRKETNRIKAMRQRVAEAIDS